MKKLIEAIKKTGKIQNREKEKLYAKINAKKYITIFF